MSNATDLDRQRILTIDRDVILGLLRPRHSGAPDLVALPDVEIEDGTTTVGVNYNFQNRAFDFALAHPRYDPVEPGRYLPRVLGTPHVRLTEYRKVGSADVEAQERAARNYHDAAVALGHFVNIKYDPRDRTWQVRVYNAGGSFIKEFSFYPDGQCAAFSQSAPVFSRWDGR